MKIKHVFIAHPIGGDIENNVKKVLEICGLIHGMEDEDGSIVVPVVPYIISLQYLNDAEEADRQLGILANREYFTSNFIHELWLYGSRISQGMWEEIFLAWENNIRIVPKTRETEREFQAFLAG